MVPKMNSNKPTCLSSSSLILFLCAFLVIFLITTCASNGGNESDYLALLSFKSMITHDPNGALSSWNNSVHFCDWNGVSCGKRHRRVTVIQIMSQGLEGSLSPHIGNLSFLRILNISTNSFQGTIPQELGRLSRLRYLDLGFNEFSGVIPVNVSHCSNLESITLHHNKLSGSIPKEITLLSKLTHFLAKRNGLTGGIPPLLGNLTSIEVFYVNSNPLGGSIPDTLGNWKRLKKIYSGNCSLYGTIPNSFYNLSLLSEVYLANNQLSGILPPAMGSMLPNLEILRLFENQFTGLLPASISNCSKLADLSVEQNNFRGKLTIDFAKLGHLNKLLLGDFYGSKEANDVNFIDGLKNCSMLRVLYLHNCNIQGVLPKSIGNLSSQLDYLSLDTNQLYGNIPSSIGNLVRMTTLYMEYNQLSGRIPSSIGKLYNLQIASFSGNHFSGLIPEVTGNLSSLTKLYLDRNRFEGQLPSSLGNCHHLLELDLSNNYLNGRIPKQLLHLSSLAINLNLSYNNLYGDLPIEIGDLNMLTSMDLSHNNLSGSIPSDLGSCTSLSFLSLQGNLFQGKVPTSLSSLRGLEELNLAQNKLSGQIPQFFEQFSSLKYLNLSFNDLEGEVPILGMFSNTSSFSVLGNRRLCGGLVELGLPKCKEAKKHKNKFLWFVIAIVSASILFTGLCLVHTWCKKKRKVQQTQSSMNEQFLKVSYNQLFKATNGFSEANLIGEGGFSSVYKGILDDDADDRIVAVKVIHLQHQGALKSFTRECEALRAIRHRNLLKIITSCSSIDFQGNDFKALICEFMPNGNLHDWLHSSADTLKLNLLQRLNILIDVATALDYLHNHCATTIIHGDLKPHNILLDDDLVAHVGDFGLARFHGSYPNQSSSIGIRGTIGYTAPEYGIGSEMTTSGDIYSFGILLLEVITGKKPSDSVFNEGFTLPKFAYLALPDHVTDVIDGNLQEKEIAMQSIEENARKIKECLASIVEVGISCSMDTPSERMNAENVVLVLHKIRHTLQNIGGIQAKRMFEPNLANVAA